MISIILNLPINNVTNAANLTIISIFSGSSINFQECVNKNCKWGKN